MCLWITLSVAYLNFSKPSLQFWRTNLELLCCCCCTSHGNESGGAELLWAVGKKWLPLKQGDSNADFGCLENRLVQLWVPKWGKKAAGLAIMGNTNIWELGAFKAAENTGNRLHWWGDSVTRRYQARSVLRCSKDMTGHLWSFHRELSAPLLCSYKWCKGGHRAESSLFAWYRQG